MTIRKNTKRITFYADKALYAWMELQAAKRKMSVSEYIAKVLETSHIRGIDE